MNGENLIKLTAMVEFNMKILIWSQQRPQIKEIYKMEKIN